MNLQLPRTPADWEAFVKENVWTIVIGALCLVALWQGLTLFGQVRSWQSLQDQVQTLIMRGVASGKNSEDTGDDAKKRALESTFFYRPSASYRITAILDGRAVVNGKEVKVGDRVENAVVEKIEVNSVTLKEEGEESPKRIELHPGL